MFLLHIWTNYQKHDLEYNLSGQVYVREKIC